MNESTVVKLAAIASLTIIAVFALNLGIDSVLVGTVSAIIGGIAGYEFKRIENKIKRAFR